MGQYGEAADGLRGIGVQTPCARVMPAVSDVVGEGVLFPETSCRHTGCTICMEEVYAHVHDAGPAVSRSVHGGERGAEVASGVESASATSHQPSFRPMLLETTSILLRAPRSFHDEAASVSTLTWSSWERHHYWIIAGMARSPRHSIRRERDSPTTADDGPPKRRRLDDSSAAAVDARKVTSRRRNACQSCRLRKVKCDAVRPTCGICEASGCICCYTDPLPEKVT